MNKVFLIFLALMATISLVFAAGNGAQAETDALVANGSQQGIHDAGTGITNPEIKNASQGTGQGLSTNSEIQNEGVSDSLQKQIQVNAGSGNGVQTQTQEQVQVQVEHPFLSLK